METGKKKNLFSKGQLLAAKRFQGRRDMIAALLVDGEMYTMEDAEQMIQTYRKGKVM